MNRPESKVRISSDEGGVKHLYVHVPFCPKICPYCSFYKEASDRNRTQAFLDAVLLELDSAPHIQPKTIFFGGGTPSALSTRQLAYLIDGLRERLDLSDLQEWTLEMNPATVSEEKALLLRSLGISRISMGVQAWQPELLDRLGRVHSATQALRSYKILRSAGFENINLDLIFGIPGQTAEQWEESLLQTIALGPEHISAYCLTYEEDTEYFLRLGAGEFVQEAGRDAALFERTMDTLEQHGYSQYEISNYARPGKECLHNLAYWTGKEYLGLGPSAFSTVASRRWQNVPNTPEYIQRIRESGRACQFTEIITPDIHRAEKIAFGLRTNLGVPEELVEPWHKPIGDLLSEGYVERNAGKVRLSRSGRMVADAIGEMFV